MKILYPAILAVIGLCDTVFGVSVVVQNNDVFVNNQKVDLTKLQVIKETDMYKKYVLHSGESTITITKMKIGNGISVNSVGPMTPEEKKKMEKMQKDIEEDVKKKIHKVNEDINTMSQKIKENIERMNKEIHSFIWQFPPWF